MRVKFEERKTCHQNLGKYILKILEKQEHIRIELNKMQFNLCHLNLQYKKEVGIGKKKKINGFVF